MKTIIAIPFESDAELLKVQPNTYTTTRPSGEIVGEVKNLQSELVFEISSNVRTAWAGAL